MVTWALWREDISSFPVRQITENIWKINRAGGRDLMGERFLPPDFIWKMDLEEATQIFKGSLVVFQVLRMQSLYAGVGIVSVQELIFSFPHLVEREQLYFF